MDQLAQVSHETMVFMRGNYRLDEIGNGKDELKFRQGSRTILTIYIREDQFSFLLIFGKKERELFEQQQEQFPDYIRQIYDSTRTYHDGKWMLFDVSTLAQLEEVKRLIRIKKKPNRKPFPQEGALYAQCGQRCDLCVHYVGTTEEQRAVMLPALAAMWGTTDWSMRCAGCSSDDCYCKDSPCHAKSCAAQKGLAACRECDEFPCIRATTADSRSMIHTETHRTDEITWGILPYVPWQYEKEKGDHYV